MEQISVQTLWGEPSGDQQAQLGGTGVLPTRPKVAEGCIEHKQEEAPGVLESNHVQDSSAAVEAFRVALNQLAEDSGSDMDTSNSSDDSLSSADSEAAAAASLSRSEISTPAPNDSFTTRLFSRSTTFASVDDFFNTCLERISTYNGLRIHRYQATPRRCSARCYFRKECDCPFIVAVAERDENLWEIDSDRTVWTHNHLVASPESNMFEDKEEEAEESGRETGPSGDEAESESEEEPLAKTVPQASFDWDIATSSQAFRKVVAKRDEILTKQRQLADSPLQKTSEDIAQSELDGLPSRAIGGQHAYYYENKKFLDFTKSLHIPPYPISGPLIVLYLCHQAVTSGGSVSVGRSWLNRLHRLLDGTWYREPLYQELRDWDDAEVAMKDFSRERYGIKKGRSRGPIVAANTSRPVALQGNSTQRATSPRFDPEEYDSDPDRSSEDDSSDQNWGSHRKGFDRSTTRTSSSESVSDEARSAEQSETDEDVTSERRQIVQSQHQGSAPRGARQNVVGGKTVIVGLPRVGQSFDSVTSAYKVCVRLTVAKLGLNVVLVPSTGGSTRINCSRGHGRYFTNAKGRCNFSIRIEEVGNRFVVATDSRFEHNHGPVAERVADPSYMPDVRNTYAREALGLPPLHSKVEPPARKKRKLVDGSSLIARQKQRQEEKEKRKRRREARKERKRMAKQQEQNIASRRQRPPSPSLSVEFVETVGAPRQTLIAQPSSRQLPAPAPSFVDPSTHFASTSTVYCPPHRQPTFSVPAPAISPTLPPFLSTLSAFLSGLHPSLVSLAPALFASGLESLDVLTCFCSLEPSMFVRFMTELSTRHQVSIVHVKLLSKRIEEFRLAARS